MDLHALTRPTQTTFGYNPFESSQRNIPISTRISQVNNNNTRPNRLRKIAFGKENMEQYFDEAAVLFCGRAAGPPVKTHWKPDSEATKCAMTFCKREFGLFERRHHCRRCGDIFCGVHCSHYIRLDQNIHFNLAGYACRVCDKCYDDYIRLLNRCKYPEPSICRLGYLEEDDDVRDGDHSTMNVGNGIDDNTKHATREDDIIREDFRNINPYYQKQLEVTYGKTPTVPANWAWSTF